MSRGKTFPFLLLAVAAGAAAFSMPETNYTSLTWQALPAIPDALGFAGSFAGRSHATLVVAGGANFPGKPPWEGGTKVWHDTVFVLPEGATAWQPAGRLPQPNGYGASLTIGDEVVLIGGGDAKQNFANASRMRWDGQALHFTPLPALPRPLAMLAAANDGSTIFVAGGLERPDATAAQPGFFSLDITRPTEGWRTLPPCPGPARFLAVAGSSDGSFYLFGGARLVPGPDGKPQREWLRDAWRYTPVQGWKRLADLPRAAVAAPSPAAVVKGRLLVIGGDDGTQVNTPAAEHRGFPREVLAYDPSSDTWSSAGTVPFSLVTTSAIIWPGHVVIPGGEKRPGVRSTEMWSAELP
jgi:N-acetylneuraminic acid mutarotase